MKIHFGRLELEGFKAFEKRQVLDFEKLGPGLHFILGKNSRARLGSNGAAKSTILDAATWCLFGQTSSGLRNPDVRPWKSKARTRVSWQLRIDDKPYLVTRTIDPNSTSINGESVGNDDLTRLLQLSQSTFSNAICLGQDQAMFLDLKPAQKMQEMFAILPSLSRWAERAAFTSRFIIQLNEKLQNLSTMRARAEAAAAQAEELHSRARTKAKSWQADVDKAIADQQENIEACKEYLEQHIKRRDAAILVNDGALLEADALGREIEKLQPLMADLRRARKDLEALPGGKGVCPTCGQSLTGTKLAKHRENLEAMVEPLLPVETNLRACQGRWEVFRKKAASAEAEIRLHSPKIAELEAKIAATARMVESQKGQANPFLSQARDLHKKLEAATKEREELTGRITKLEARIERTRYWTRGFKDLQLYLIEEVLQELELVTNSVLVDLGLEDWTMEYVIEKETKSGTVTRGLAVLISSPDTPKPVRWECYSGGERQRLRVAASLALSEVLLANAGVVPSMIALDEPSHNLSDQGMEDLCAYLAERCRTLGQQCFLIDHLVTPSSHFASTIEVVKSADGTSTILRGAAAGA